MAGSSISSMLMNPKFLVKSAYFMLIAFGAFHFTKLFMSVFGAVVLSRFNKPQLVRETSKIYVQGNSNLFMLPWMYGKKFISKRMRRSEKDLLDGVILEKNLEE
jgi:hypothetical protein